MQSSQEKRQIHFRRSDGRRQSRPGLLFSILLFVARCQHESSSAATTESAFHVESPFRSQQQQQHAVRRRRIKWTQSREVLSLPAALDAEQEVAQSYTEDQKAAAATTKNTIKSKKGVRIDGLTANFDRLNKMHSTLEVLRAHLPVLLTSPLTEDIARSTLTENVRLCVKGDKSEKELASSRNEAVRLCNTLVVASTVSRQATNWITSSFFGGNAAGSSTTSTEASPVVNATILLHSMDDSNGDLQFRLDSFQVAWETDVRAFSAALALTTNGRRSSEGGGGDDDNNNNGDSSLYKLQGLSRFVLDPDTAKISSIQLEKVIWNGQVQDAQAIGDTLSTLRQAVLRVQESPLVRAVLSGPAAALTASSSSSSSPSSSSSSSIWNQVWEEFTQNQQQQQQATKERKQRISPVHVYVPLAQNADNTVSTITKESIPVDEFINRHGHQSKREGDESMTEPCCIPFPGSSQWPAYALAHLTCLQFVDTVIPILSASSNTEDSLILQSYFASDVQLLALDGSVLLQDASRVSNFFRFLSTWRERSFGSWQIQKAVVLDWNSDSVVASKKGGPRIRVDYTTSATVPGTASIAIEGSDIFTLGALPFDGASTKGTIAKVPAKPVIVQVQQSFLNMGSGQKYNQQDALWVMKSLAAASETSRLQGTDDRFWMELLKRVSSRGRPAVSGNRPDEKNSAAAGKVSKPTLSFPIRDDSAALTVYRVMESLHREIPLIMTQAASTDSSASVIQLPPASEYTSENIQLRGNLNQVLLRGRSQYNRNIGLSIGSLRAALSSGRLLSEKPPAVKVELNAQGNIRCSWTLYLKVAAIGIGAGGTGGRFSLGRPMDWEGVAGLPLVLSLVSDYILCPETGKIVQHALVESRVNGQLTPGDVVARWLSPPWSKGNQVESSEQDPTWSLVRDTLDWLRPRSQK